MKSGINGRPPDNKVEARRSRWPWALIALTPLLLALASWDPAGSYHPVQSGVRLYGVPAIAVELAALGYAIWSGADPLRHLGLLSPWAKVAFGLLVTISFATAAFAPFPLRALSWTLCSVIHVFFGLAVASLAREMTSNDRASVWKAILFGLCGYVVAVIVFVPAALAKGTLYWEYFGLGVTNIRQVGFFSVVGAGASLGLASIEARRARWWILVAAAALMLAISFWSGTRGALLAIVVSFAIGAVALPAFRWFKAWLALSIAMAAGAALSLAGPIPSPIFGIVRLGASSGSGSADASSGRLEIWASTWDAIVQRPFLGHGAGQYFMVIHGQLGAFNHPHNIALQVLFQWGVAGALCYFALGILILRRALGALGNPQPADAPAFLAGTALLIMSLYEGSLFHSYPSMMVALALSLIIAPQVRGAQPQGG